MPEPTQSANKFENNREVVKQIKHDYKGVIAENIAIIIDECEKAGITNQFTQIGILACIGKESGFIPQVEKSYRNTSNERLRKIFGKRLAELSESDLDSLKHFDKGFFNKVYGGRFGNVDFSDGYSYRGRGFNQITFADNYRTYAGKTGVDIFTNPDLLNNVDVAAKCAVSFFKTGAYTFGYNINSFTNQEDATYAIVRINNGGGDVSKSEGLRISKEYEKHFTIEYLNT